MRRAIITWFGCGDMPFASGTWGSAGALVAAGLWYLICRAAPPQHAWGLLHAGLAIGILIASILSVRWGEWAVTAFEHHPNTRKPGDPGAFVLDEVAGQWGSLLLLPMSTWTHAIVIVAVQFFLFRLFDVVKPPPGRMLERLPAGWGILLDDLSSAIYANLIGQAMFRVWLVWT